MTKLILFGQRGVGKSTLLRRLRAYFSDCNLFIDLDEEIARAAGCSVAEIFARQGEAGFRQLELLVFNEVVAPLKKSFVCAVGAGFPVQTIPPDMKCVWLQRPSDSLGRIFLDRPRLEPHQDPLTEYFARAHERAPAFVARADEIYVAPEGLRAADAVEGEILSPRIADFGGGAITLSRWHLARPEYLEKIGRSNFELRTDWLTPAEIASVADRPHIFSVRTRDATWPAHAVVDWALELGPPPTSSEIVSVHEFLPGEKLSQLLTRLESAGGDRDLKAAPMVADFAQLRELYEWQSANPARRSILPRSENGRWAWLRLYMKGRQRLNFWRDGVGSAVDQPTLFQWLSTPSKPAAFAAVIGDPVEHSRTPVEHKEFFARRGWPVFAVQISREEIPDAFGFLQELGLQAAAVTAPHKQWAFIESVAEDATTQSLQAVNSLWRQDSRWIGTNTDLAGMSVLARSGVAVIWGGGGTLAVAQRVFPHAVPYSVRSGLPRAGLAPAVRPEVLIWAAGPRAEMPRGMESVKTVVDLNYREDSQARVFALRVGAVYVSGEAMFLEQAARQREWFLGKGRS